MHKIRSIARAIVQRAPSAPQKNMSSMQQSISQVRMSAAIAQSGWCIEYMAPWYQCSPAPFAIDANGRLVPQEVLIAQQPPKFVSDEGSRGPQ